MGAGAKVGGVSRQQKQELGPRAGGSTLCTRACTHTRAAPAPRYLRHQWHDKSGIPRTLRDLLYS